MKRNPGAITFGKMLRTAEISGFILTETAHAPDFVLPRHDHECGNFNFVLGGGLCETFGRHTADCKPSSLVVKPPGEFHSNRYGPAGAHCLIVEVTSSKLAELRPCAGFLDRPAFHQDPYLAGRLLRIRSELHTLDHSAKLIVEGLILELLGQMGRESRRGSATPPAWLKRVCDLIHDQPHEVGSLSTLAAAAGVHPNYLARIFRRFYRCSVGEYSRRLRLEQAARMLAATEKPLADVAAEAGFYDQSHFTHAFKKHFQLTPSAFRRASGSKTDTGTSTTFSD
jgi:AraC family transcriptional regulator